MSETNQEENLEVKRLGDFFESLENFELRVTDKGTRYEIEMHRPVFSERTGLFCFNNDKKEKHTFSYWVYLWKRIHRLCHLSSSQTRTNRVLQNMPDELVYFFSPSAKANIPNMAKYFVPFIDLAITERLVEEGDALRPRLEESQRLTALEHIRVDELTRQLTACESEKIRDEILIADQKEKLQSMFSECPRCHYKQETLQGDVGT